MKPFIIPIFIPNVACPHRCVFCEQQRITSETEGIPNPEKIRSIIELAIKSRKFPKTRRAEVAFYGGTFTGLSLAKMASLLAPIAPYIDKGFISHIRISTRPDFVDSRKLDFIKQFSVKIVELGAQSMNDTVLQASRRGHTSEDTVRAVTELRNHQFLVGIQLMPGLPGDSQKIFRETVEKVIELKPDYVRLYPTVAIKGTALARYYEKGKYHPLGLEEAVVICADAVDRFESSGIQVIRIGLMSSPSLIEGGQVVAGPWHPNFGELVRCKIYHRKISKSLPMGTDGKTLEIRVNIREVPLFRGFKNSEIRRIERLTGARNIKVKGDERIPKGKIEVKII